MKAMFKAYYFYCCSITLFLSVAAQAQITHLPNRDSCSRYSGNLQACIADNNCDYDFRSGICSEYGSHGGGGNHGTNCHDFDYNRNLCQSYPECRYVPQTSRCVDDNSPGQNRCSVYDNNPNRCDTTIGCEYDYQYRQCNPDNGGNHGGRTQTITLSCSSDNYRYEECYVGGDVISVDLLRQDSSSSCSLNRSYGEARNAIWVDHGCRGLFRVTYRN